MFGRKGFGKPMRRGEWSSDAFWCRQELDWVTGKIFLSAHWRSCFTLKWRQILDLEIHIINSHIAQRKSWPVVGSHFQWGHLCICAHPLLGINFILLGGVWVEGHRKALYSWHCQDFSSSARVIKDYRTGSFEAALREAWQTPFRIGKWAEAWWRVKSETVEADRKARRGRARIQIFKFESHQNREVQETRVTDNAPRDKIRVPSGHSCPGLFALRYSLSRDSENNLFWRWALQILHSNTKTSLVTKNGSRQDWI